MTLVSFYADPPGTSYYSVAAERLRAICRKHSIANRIVQLGSAGSWLANTALKAGFVRSMVHELGAVLWVDVDSVVGGNPLRIAWDTLDGVDAAFAGFGNKASRAFTPASPLPESLLCSPLRVMGIAHAWAHTRGALAVLDRWVELCDGPLTDRHGDHRLMQRALDEAQVADKVRFRYFPDTIGRGPLIRLGLARNVPGRSAAMTKGRRG